MPQSANLRDKELNFSATGDNIVIPAVVGERLCIYRVNMQVKGTTELRFRNGVGGPYFNNEPYTFAGSAASPGAFVMDYDTSPYWRTARGGPFVIELTPGVIITGRIYYLLGSLCVSLLSLSSLLHAVLGV